MRSALLALMLAACQRVPDAPPPDEAQGNAAYDARQYARCAEIFDGVAQRQPSTRDSSLYSAACCYALDGKLDRAFARLDQAIEAGLVNRQHVERDNDLAALHSDPRWPAVLEALDRAEATWERTLGDPALRRELRDRFHKDQEARDAWVKAGMGDTAMAARVEAIDSDNTARLKEVVARVGWPGKKLVGSDGARWAWLLVQHADRDHAFQVQCLALLERAVATGDAGEAEYAYLYDRIATAEGRPQRYGTQFKDDKPFPIEDEAHVDERRKRLGMPTMAEYAEQIRATYGPAK
jgi:hypothetical protein